MKNLLAGLILGIAFCAILGYLKLPQIKQESYDKGFAEGKKAGIDSGSTSALNEGIAQGIAQEQAKQKGTMDSLSNEVAKTKEAQSKAQRVIVEEKPKVQNWRVLGGNISEPILDADTAN